MGFVDAMVRQVRKLLRASIEQAMAGYATLDVYANENDPDDGFAVIFIPATMVPEFRALLRAKMGEPAEIDYGVVFDPEAN